MTNNSSGMQRMAYFVNSLGAEKQSCRCWAKRIIVRCGHNDEGAAVEAHRCSNFPKNYVFYLVFRKWEILCQMIPVASQFLATSTDVAVAARLSTYLLQD